MTSGKIFYPVVSTEVYEYSVWKWDNNHSCFVPHTNAYGQVVKCACGAIFAQGTMGMRGQIRWEGMYGPDKYKDLVPPPKEIFNSTYDTLSTVTPYPFTDAPTEYGRPISIFDQIGEFGDIQ